MSDETRLAPAGDGDEGRAPGGQFAPGNKYGKGNPHAKRVQQIRSALLEVCSPERMQAAAEQLMKQAEAGDRFAFAELADRVIGKAVAADLLQRLEALEESLLENRNG